MIYSVTYKYYDFIDGEDMLCNGDGGSYVSYDIATAVACTLTESGCPAQVHSHDPRGTDY